MRRRRHFLVALAAIAAAGCATEAPIGKPTIDVEAAQARAAEIDRSPINRDGVHALLGEPWLASEVFGVEVYRLQGKQRNLLVVFAPYPVPVPSLSNKIEAYSLVVYGADGNVSARASDYVRAAAGEAPTLILRAGAFQFVHSLRDSLTVSLDRYLQVRAVHATNPTCTVLLGPDPVRLAAADAGGFCSSTVNLYLDDRKRQAVWLAAPAVIPPSRTSAVDCRNAGGSYEVFTAGAPGACVFKPRTLYPLTLPVGRHVLRFTSGLSDKGVVSALSCQADQLTYATLQGKFMRCMHVEDGRVHSDRQDDESVLLSTQPPVPDHELQVIINDDGTWLYPP
jgi:hypothetical protein